VARPLFDRLHDPELVAEAIRSDGSLSEPIRRAALDVAARLQIATHNPALRPDASGAK
jgi:hypothetical protein